MKNFLITIGAFFVTINFALPVKAAVALPKIMAGQAMISYENDGLNYYNSTTGNEAIINYYPDLPMGFNSTLLDNTHDCYNAVLNTVNHCYVYDSFSSKPAASAAIKLMRSKTIIDDSKVFSENVALFYAPSMIIGDAYANNDYLSNFAFWGRNLAMSSSSTTSRDGSASWSVPNYALNPSAQSSWTSQQFTDFKNKLDTQRSESMEIGANLLNNTTPVTWFLQSATPEAINHDPDVIGQKDSAAEGKFWYVKNKDLTIKKGTDIHYRGKGTIFVDGDLTIIDSTILPLSDNGAASSLGFVVYGKVKLVGNVKLNAAVICPTVGKVFDISGGTNLDLDGSFIASNFSSPPSGSNVRFNYDYRLSKDWPPGFRFLAQ